MITLYLLCKHQRNNKLYNFHWERRDYFVTIYIPSYPGYQRFFSRKWRRKAAGTARAAKAARKTSGTERFKSPCSLNFDHFYRIIFKPITAKISYCEHVNLRSGVPYIICRGGKVRLIQLLDYLSVASPESGLFSDWSRNKKVLRTEP